MAGVSEEVGEDGFAVGRVGDFGVELQAVEQSGAMLHGGQWACVGAGERDELIGNHFHLIAVAHPDFRFAADAGEEIVRFFGGRDPAASAAKFAHGVTLHAAAERLAHELHAVANAEHGDAEVEECGITLRGAGGVNAGRSAGEDDAYRSELANARGREVVSHDFTVHVLLADAARDELGVLRAEIENEHAFGGKFGCGVVGFDWHGDGIIALQDEVNQ